MFRSERLDNPPLSVVWRPQGDTFLVGLHNHVLLCDAAGWQAAHAQHTAGGGQVRCTSLFEQLHPLGVIGFLCCIMHQISLLLFCNSGAQTCKTRVTGLVAKGWCYCNNGYQVL